LKKSQGFEERYLYIFSFCVFYGRSIECWELSSHRI